MLHHQIVIIGGGNAGISTAAQLLRKNRSLDIAIVDPSEKHYYQPAWTLVGGCAFDINKTMRSEASVIPKGVKWIKQKAIAFSPEQNQITLDNGPLQYDYLIVCPGIQLNWGDIKGLPETLGKNNVCSNYSLNQPLTRLSVLKISKAGKRFFTILLPQ